MSRLILAGRYGLSVALLLLLYPAPAAAQNEDAPTLYLLADAQDGYVDLRWAPASVELLERGFTEGYRLFRNEESGAETELALLRPAPRPAWLPLADTSANATVLASVIYPDEEMDLDLRYGLALLAADLDFAAARAAGLGYRDEEVLPGKRYEYTLEIAGEQMKIKVNSDARYQPPPVENLRGLGTRERAELAWLREATDDDYTAYIVERRINNGPFAQISARPQVQLLEEEQYDSLQFYRDTFPVVVADVEYGYRVRGITPFGRLGPPGEVVTVRPLGDPELRRPSISRMIKTGQAGHRITWEAPAEVPDYYVVEASPRGFDGFTPRSPELLVDQNSFVEPKPRHGYFYRVVAHFADGTATASSAKLLLVGDTQPPAIPTGLTGTVDSFGHVVLVWEDNPEDDILGYRVTFSNRPTGHFTQLTERELGLALFRDTVTMETRNESVYYKVFAVDYAGNYGQPTEAYEVKRPDFRPPTPPVVRRVSPSERGVRIEYALSSSDDVVAHYFERYDEDAGTWRTLETLTWDAEIYQFTDTTAVPARNYDYRLRAVDDADLTALSDVTRTQRTDTGLRAAIRDFSVRALTTSPTAAITWTYPTGGELQDFQLYRAENGGTLRAYKLLDASTPGLRVRQGVFTFLDKNLTPGNNYIYRLLARHFNGGYSPLTPTQTITVPN